MHNTVPLWRSLALSAVILAAFLAYWQWSLSKPTVGRAKLPTPMQVGETAWKELRHPFYDNGPNDKGIGIQLAASLGRVLTGDGLAALVAIPFGFLLGMSPLWQRAFDPFIQTLRPVSPLAWMPLALFTIRNAGQSAIFVIFVYSLWPMLITTRLSG